MRTIPRGLVNEHATTVDLRGGIRHVVRKCLEGAERLVELRPYLAVLRRDLEHLVGTADGLGREQDDAVEHHALEGFPARSGGPDPVVRRDAYTIERDAVLCIRRLREELLLRNAIRLWVDEEEIDPRLCPSEHDQARRRGCEVDVLLRSRQDEAIAVRLGGELNADWAEAAVWLEPRRGEDGLSRRDLREATPSSVRRCRLLPKAPALITAETKWGTEASARPSSSYTSAASSSVCPPPAILETGS